MTTSIQVNVVCSKMRIHTVNQHVLNGLSGNALLHFFNPNYYRNHHAKFEINNSISNINDKSFPKLTDRHANGPTDGPKKLLFSKYVQYIAKSRFKVVLNIYLASK